MTASPLSTERAPRKVRSDAMTVIFMSVIAAISTAALAAIACTAQIAWRLLQGRFFTAPTSTALRTLTWSLTFGFVAVFGFWSMGANGVSGALGMRATANVGDEWWGWYWLALFAITSFGLIDIGLRRAIRLQRETEGLV